MPLHYSVKPSSVKTEDNMKPVPMMIIMLLMIPFNLGGFEKRAPKPKSKKTTPVVKLMKNAI
ncbi:hypothetical protein BBEV_3150 [Salisediminibacterium beveridgei]|uniref:Uncharacterized protein n=1 Tax=Salisediminibacterium beveridgei TaxID=632773 RepID=A0A1D7QZN2_9BACI|nr:hypothetical protein BBEV_3150 [Salisediminibacterium beveridgei]